MNNLRIYHGVHLERELPLRDVTSIGRLKKNTVQLEASGISRVHAMITRTETGYVVVDRGSRNGTRLNGKRLSPDAAVELASGDRIKIEDFELHIEFGNQRTRFDPEQVGESAVALELSLNAPPGDSLPLSSVASQKGSASIWSKGATQIVLADIVDEGRDVKTFRFAGAKSQLFSFDPGQFVTLTFDIEFETIHRSFSLSSGPSRPHTLDLTVKRSEEGRVSSWMHDRLRLGDELSMRGPSGSFTCTPYPSRRLLFIAGGIGMAPIMSMCRWIVDTAADVDVVVLQSASTPADMIFRKELNFLATRHRNFRVTHSVTSNWAGPQTWSDRDGRTGHVDQAFLEECVPDLDERHVYLCAPPDMQRSVLEALSALAFPLEHLHRESFQPERLAAGVTPEPPSEPPSLFAPPSAGLRERDGSSAGDSTAEAASSPPPSYLIRFERSNIEVTTDGKSPLLNLAEANGIEIAYGCRMGACGACDTLSATGSTGTLRTCITRPTSDVALEA